VLPVLPVLQTGLNVMLILCGIKDKQLIPGSSGWFFTQDIQGRGKAKYLEITFCMDLLNIEDFFKSVSKCS